MPRAALGVHKFKTEDMAWIKLLNRKSIAQTRRAEFEEDREALD